MPRELLVARSMPAETMTPTGDGWTVEGVAVPYGRAQRVSDDGGTTYYREGFAAGAFARDATRGGAWVNLMHSHQGDDGDRYLGRCVGLQDRSYGLWATFRLNRDHPMAEAARSGDLTGWSVSAKVYSTREEKDQDGPVLWRERCGLSHVAATPRPQYAGAGVRVNREHRRLDALVARGFGTGSVGAIQLTATPRLDALRAAGLGRGPGHG